LKSFTSHCPSIFPYNFSKGNPDFVRGVVRGTVPLTISKLSGGRFLGCQGDGSFDTVVKRNVPLALR
jgi:hypothetical protein